MAAAWIGLVLAVLPLWPVPARAAVPVQLLVLGDSLSAGYGLPRADGFEAQLGAALRARGLDVRIVDAADAHLKLTSFFRACLPATTG